VLRLLVWAVIAAALVVLAFRGGSSDDGAVAAGPGAPTVDLTSPTVPVTRGTVSNTVSVSGTVVADPAVPVQATRAGTVRRLLVEEGADVTEGQPLLEIRWEEEVAPVTATGPEGEPTTTPQQPRVRTATVTAPAAQVALVESARRDLCNAGRIAELSAVAGDGPLTVDVVLAEVPAAE